MKITGIDLTQTLTKLYNDDPLTYGELFVEYENGENDTDSQEAALRFLNDETDSHDADSKMVFMFVVDDLVIDFKDSRARDPDDGYTSIQESIGKQDTE